MKPSIPNIIKKEKTSSLTLVSRSTVPENLKYTEYKPYLRKDFFYSCAYCTMTESEAQAIRFTIDHYEPRSSYPNLENQYNNLMYACDECNTRKGNRNPPPEARSKGYRFFRPDHDFHHEHFEKNGIRLKSKSNIGHYTIEAIDLNRQSLRRLRDIRTRLIGCEQYVTEGILALRGFPIDRLPPHIKQQAAESIKKAKNMADMLASNIDSLLMKYAQSPLIDPNDSVEEARITQRNSELKKIEALYPGNWRTRVQAKK